jgi:hypothetical protein
VSPPLDAAGAAILITYGGAVNVCTRLPFTETVTLASTRLSAAWMSTAAGRNWDAFGSAVSAIVGGVESRVTITCAVAGGRFSTASVADTMIVLSPSARSMVAVKPRGPAAGGSSVAGIPLTVRVARLTSCTVPVTVIDPAAVSVPDSGVAI